MAHHGTSWHIMARHRMAHHGMSRQCAPWYATTMRTLACHIMTAAVFKKTHILELNLRSHGMRDGGKQTPENKDGGITIPVWTMPQFISVLLRMFLNMARTKPFSSFFVTYVSHSDSIELVNLGFLSFFYPSCPSLPKRVQFSSCWQRLSDADLCHKGTCMHACMHAAAYSVTMRAACFPTTQT